jgi:predicted RNA binding protein YcfA (HicA-like mRNA interferase family)
MKIKRNISGIELIKIFKKKGFVVTRQKGSHIRLEKFDGEKNIKLTIPNHKQLKVGTLQNILKFANLNYEDLF